jgi:O-antigen ligase
MNIVGFLDLLISGTFYLLFFLVPLVFSSSTSELFEYNKMMLTYGATVVIVAAWIAKMIATKKFVYRRTFLEIPLLLYLGSHILSTIYSIDPHISIWGYYSRFHEGLLATISYILLYFAAVSNLSAVHVKRILYFSFASAIIVSVWGAMEHFGNSPSCMIITHKTGVDCWIQDVKNRVFATLGQPNWMAAFLDVIIFALLGFARKYQNKFVLILAPLFLFALYCTKSRSGFLGLGVGLFALVLAVIKIDNRLKVLICAVALAVGSAAGSYYYQHLPAPGPGITDSEAIRKPVWEGAIKVWQRYPVLGSGVETFAYSFYKDRPVSKNLDSEWDFLYNKAHNEYLNLLATTGTVGILTYAGFIGTFILWFVKKIVIPDSKFLLPASLFAGWTTILITNFLGFSVVIVGLFFFLIPAFSFLLDTDDKIEPQPAKEIDAMGFCFIGLVIFVAFIMELSLINMRNADKDYNDGKLRNATNQTEQFVVANASLTKAVTANPDEPTYRDELAYNQSVLASALFAQIKNATATAITALTPAEKMNLKSPQLNASVNELVSQAIKNSDEALTVSPHSFPFWKNRTKMFYQLAAIDEKYYSQALQSLTRASEVAPTDAKVFYNLGLLLDRTGDKAQAKRNMQKALEMKHDYQEVKDWLKKESDVQP